MARPRRRRGRTAVAWRGEVSAGPLAPSDATHVFFTVGEVVAAPVAQTVTSVLAPRHRRATYFTLLTLAFGLASFAGPGLGGLGLAAGGKWALFGGMTVADGAAALLYWRGLAQDPRFLRPVGELAKAMGS
jgi:hypothetical protein